MTMRTSWLWLGLLALGAPQTVSAEVTVQSDSGFIISLASEVPAARADVWKALVNPAKWWSAEHTWSGDPANLYIDSQATGCFCEKLPKPADAPADQRMGSVEHMHIVFADPQTGYLRVRGGLGPLQDEPVEGVWTINLRPTAAGGTRIEWTYAVNGLMRMKGGDVAPLVDHVMADQLARLAALFTPTGAPPPAPTG